MLQPIDAESRPISIRRSMRLWCCRMLCVPSILENTLVRYVEDGGSVLMAAGMSAAHQADSGVWRNVVGRAFLCAGMAMRRGRPD